LFFPFFPHQDGGETAYKNSIILAQENLTTALLRQSAQSTFCELLVFYKI
jgi:hypothetical protein